MQTVSGQLQEGAQVTGDRLQQLGQTASTQLQATAQRTGDTLHEMGQTASDRLQEAAQITNDRLQHLGHAASDTAQEVGPSLHNLSRTATTAMTNAILDPAAQKAFVIGKVTHREVMTPTGSLLAVEGQPITHELAATAESLGILDDLYRATGGSWTQPLGARLEGAVASATVEQAEGRRAQHLVRNEVGSILVAPGQIVTPVVVERAKFYHRERLLLQAVGLSAGADLQERAGHSAAGAGDRLQGTGDQLQAGIKGLWHQLQQTASDLQHRSARAIEAKHIQAALGRPVTRVILDQQDEVILNVGELITHQAIASARQAEVLDLLLSSVYTAKPQLSLDDLRAPQPGVAAL